MPKLKPSETEEQNKKTKACIVKCMAMQDMNDEEVANKLHVTKRTFQNKKKRPETFNLGELRKLSTILKFSQEDKSMII